MTRKEQEEDAEEVNLLICAKHTVYIIMQIFTLWGLSFPGKGCIDRFNKQVSSKSHIFVKTNDGTNRTNKKDIYL